MRCHPEVGLGVVGTATISGAAGIRTVGVRDFGAGDSAVLGLSATVDVGLGVRAQCADDVVGLPLVVEGAVVWRAADAAGIAFAGVPPETEARITAFVGRKSL